LLERRPAGFGLAIPTDLCINNATI
jgi:hypothetical protein